VRKPNPGEVEVDTAAQPVAWNVSLADGEKIARVTLYVNGALQGFVDLALTVAEYEKLTNLGDSGHVFMSPNVNHPARPH
jgi:hypothetical protein